MIPYTWQLLEMRMRSEIFSESKTRFLDNNISKKIRRRISLLMKVPVLFPKIFDYPFTYQK